MPRKIRYILPELAHHAIPRGNNRQSTFLDIDDRLSFLNNFEKYGDENKVCIGALIIGLQVLENICWAM